MTTVYHRRLFAGILNPLIVAVALSCAQPPAAGAVDAVAPIFAGPGLYDSDDGTFGYNDRRDAGAAYDISRFDGDDDYHSYYDDSGQDSAVPHADTTAVAAAGRAAGHRAQLAAGNGGKPCSCCACKKRNALSKAAAGAYRPLFYDNKFDYLDDPCYDDWHLGENAKRRRCRDCWTLDVGGQYRLRYQSEHNLRLRPLSGANDDFLLHRTRLYGNVEYSDWLRVYGEAIDATSNGQRNVPRPIEVNRFDALNLFADFKVWEQYDKQMWVRPGRQELLYGAQRLVSPLDWSNTRRTFDGVKAYWRGPRWEVDGWWTQPVPFLQHLDRRGLQDRNFDRANGQRDFVGLWARYKTQEGRALEGFYLRLDDVSGTRGHVQGTRGDFDYNTFGGRVLGQQCGLLYELWGAYQFGQWANDDISAGFFTVGLGKKFSAPWTPTLWAYYDWASGDRNLNNDRIGTANQLFPLGHKYLGFMDIFGRQNIQDANVLLLTQPADRVTFLIWYHAFFLQSDVDAVYGVGSAPIYQDPTGNAGKQLGQELDLLVRWVLAPRMNAWFGYSHFFTDNYFESPAIRAQGANGEDADFFYTQLTINF